MKHHANSKFALFFHQFRFSRREIFKKSAEYWKNLVKIFLWKSEKICMKISKNESEISFLKLKIRLETLKIGLIISENCLENLWKLFWKSLKVDQKISSNWIENLKIDLKIWKFVWKSLSHLNNSENSAEKSYNWGLPCNNSIGAWRHLLSLFSSDEMIGNLSDN